MQKCSSIFNARNHEGQQKNGISSEFEHRRNHTERFAWFFLSWFFFSIDYSGVIFCELLLTVFHFINFNLFLRVSGFHYFRWPGFFFIPRWQLWFPFPELVVLIVVVWLFLALGEGTTCARVFSPFAAIVILPLSRAEFQADVICFQPGNPDLLHSWKTLSSSAFATKTTTTTAKRKICWWNSLMGVVGIFFPSPRTSG